MQKSKYNIIQIKIKGVLSEEDTTSKTTALRDIKNLSDIGKEILREHSFGDDEEAYNKIMALRQKMTDITYKQMPAIITAINTSNDLDLEGIRQQIKNIAQEVSNINETIIKVSSGISRAAPSQSIWNIPLIDPNAQDPSKFWDKFIPSNPFSSRQGAPMMGEAMNESSGILRAAPTDTFLSPGTDEWNKWWENNNNRLMDDQRNFSTPSDTMNDAQKRQRLLDMMKGTSRQGAPMMEETGETKAPLQEQDLCDLLVAQYNLSVDNQKEFVSAIENSIPLYQDKEVDDKAKIRRVSKEAHDMLSQYYYGQASTDDINKEKIDIRSFDATKEKWGLIVEYFAKVGVVLTPEKDIVSYKSFQEQVDKLRNDGHTQSQGL